MADSREGEEKKKTKTLWIPYICCLAAVLQSQWVYKQLLTVVFSSTIITLYLMFTFFSPGILFAMQSKTIESSFFQ